MTAVSLATLAQCTAQEVADHIVQHILKQGKPALNDSGKCVYRNKEGLACAAGSCMTNEEYKPEFEGDRWRALVVDKFVPSAHMHLINTLQDVHDTIHYPHWPERLKAECALLDLEYNPSPSEN